ncbi:SRPBCC family protein [Sedimentitalea nanhaiensis]|uniref:Uncharacterized conserved protein YndB, AHSA1/START domain n=1 Tax=Sedimentitalea nanhaiensis TaxID=999627 RepID=A0A1I6XAL4_9RHOB|nr:SRPBCC domain-containing protein [Sedimentitalea nanhaiensis]SFT35329.1 Uncharacterized conserved protein YndB, AHSA1/START domain [Sedimentitalea nanhaiensis]
MKDLHDVEFIREYAVSVSRLWNAVTRPDQVVQWFGTEGVRLETCQLDLTQTGPWLCVMIGTDSGNRFKVSGHVTHVTPPQNGGAGSVGFTWGWHDDTDARGPDSHVTFTVAPIETGARFTLTHRDLATVDSAQSHSRGWLSTLNRLDQFVTTLSTPT